MVLQHSRFWDGTAIGHAVEAPYDGPSDLAAVLLSLAGAGAIPTNLGGVFVGELNELVAVAVAPNVNIGSGRALVWGTWYENLATYVQPIATPAVATRIDRFVLRKDWTAQTVLITLLPGVEGGGEPALVQSEGITWDNPLAAVTITTGGVITVTDERDFLGPRAVGWYGDGSDGDVVISSDTALTQDMYYERLTVNAGVTLTTAGYRVFASKVISINGTVDCSGAPGVATLGGFGLAGSLLGGTNGGDNVTKGQNFAANTAGYGGLGGAGGGVTNPGQPAGTRGSRIQFPRSRAIAILGSGIGGGSGGGGGGDGVHSTVPNGGAGAGGGYLLLCAPLITVGLPGIVQANGGVGASGFSAGGAGNSGGGGGGGGGLVVLICDAFSNLGLMQALGGVGGAGNGTGTAGVDGSVGLVVSLVGN